MNWFPQTGLGSLVQLPLQQRRRWRAIVNETETGERIALADPASGEIEWRLTYRDLSDGEAVKIQALFEACMGRYGSFGFADPIGNLIAWSEDLSRPDWQSGLLSLTAGAADPVGTLRGWTITNGSPGTQSLSQTVGIPGEYTGCFSLWVRAGNRGAFTMARDGVQSRVVIDAVWKRVFVSGSGASATNRSNVSLTLGPGQTIEVWGLQFEAQPYASQYKATGGASHIYEETYFATDEITMVSTGPGLTSCEVQLVSRT